MTELMRKIVYYENILEFKDNTKSRLELNEANHWNLCRTCLNDSNISNISSFGGGGMCVMGIDGSLLDVKDMLKATVDLQVSDDDGLPTKICKDCFSKLSTLYYFILQIKRAETILKRMVLKLNSGNKSDIEKPKEPSKHTVNVMANDADCSTTNDENGVNNRVADISLETDTYSVVPKQEILVEPDEEEDDMEAVQSEDDNDNEESMEVSDLMFEDEDNLEDITKEEYILEEIQDDISNDSQNYSLNIETQEDYKEKEEGAKDDTFVERTKYIDEDVGSREQFKGSHKKKRRGGKALLDSFNCLICNTIFTLQRELISHVQDAHPKSQAFKCRVCGRMFTHLQSLSRHMQNHLPRISTKVCNICDKTFRRSDDWRRHQRIHTGERPYVCSICQKGFKQASELKEHNNTHTKERRYKCEICGHILQSRNGLYIHKKVHRGLKEHKCVHCEKTFVTKGELKSHLNVHLNKIDSSV